MNTNNSDGENIVALAPNPRVQRNKVLNEVLGYWEALRAGRVVPSRADVDPRGIERALEYAFVLERIAPSIARFRLAGMHLVDLMGMEVRGMPVTSFFTPRARQRVSEALEAAFQGPSVVELVLEAEAGIGKPPMTARMLILPMKSDLGDVSRALGCLIAEGETGRTPRRFEVQDVIITKAVAGRPMGTEAERRATPVAEVTMTPMAPTAAAAERIPGFAEAKAGFNGAAPKRGAHLRLVKTDE